MSQKQGVTPGLSPGGKIWLDKVRSLILGKLVKSGGAGSVYLLPGAPAQVAKLYHPHLDRAANRRKLEAMLELSPELPDQLENGKRYVQIAWPQAAVFDGQGGFAGFVMPLLDMAQTAELEQIMQERQARAAGLPTGLGPKLTLAANLAAVIDALHQQQHYVVDLKPVNLRFYRDSLYIAMLDCDGFSIQGHAERFPAEQFTADYLAPEFQRKGMPAGTEMAQDRFALAVIIFQLLNFGIHPYSGRPGNAQVATDIPGRIRDGCYAYGVKRHKQLAPNATSGHALMPPELRAMFDRAFSQSPKPQRPSAADWAQLLRGYAQRSGGKLVVCTVNPEHQYFAGQGCAACARDKVIGAAAQASVQAQQMQLQQPSLPQQRSARGAHHTAPGQAPVTIPLSGNAGGGITGKGWAVVVLLIVLFLIGFTAWTSSPDEVKAKAEMQAQAEQAADLEVFSWRPRKAAGFHPSDARKAVRSLSQAVSKGDDDAVTRGLQLLYRSGQEKPSGYGVESTQAQLRASLLEGLGWVPGYEPGLVATYLDLLQANPRDHLVAAAMGRMHLSLNEPQAARQYFEQAVWAHPTDGTAWLGIAAAAQLRGGDEGDAVNLVALAQLTAYRYAVEHALPAEPGQPADNGVARMTQRMDLNAKVLRLAQPGAYQKRWDKVLADGALLAAKLKALPPLRDQVGGVQRETMTTVAYGVLDEKHATGENRLTLTIAADGTLSYAAAELPMEPMLNKVLLDSVKRWTYLPAVQHGQLRDAEVVVLVRYRNGRVSFVPGGVAVTADN
jgi:eukaryotic-like serine/threonine-protein kinase